MQTPLKSLVIICGALACAGCAATSSGPKRPGMINHSVFIKLKNPADLAEITADSDRDLRGIPGIVMYSAGPRLEPPRANADVSYDFGVFMAFDSVADYQRYLEDPRHLAAVEKWKSRWDSIRICDVVDLTP